MCIFLQYGIQTSRDVINNTLTCPIVRPRFERNNIQLQSSDEATEQKVVCALKNLGEKKLQCCQSRCISDDVTSSIS
jgi:hypothetical protein